MLPVLGGGGAPPGAVRAHPADWSTSVARVGWSLASFFDSTSINPHLKTARAAVFSGCTDEHISAPLPGWRWRWVGVDQPQQKMEDLKDVPMLNNVKSHRWLSFS